MKEELYWYFSANRTVYRAAVVTVLVLGLLGIILTAMNHRKRSQREMVLTWPIVEATIIESKQIFKDTSTESNFGGENHVRLRVRYQSQESGVEIETLVDGHWYYKNSVGKKDQFEVGKKIRLRVDPDNPERTSLIDITGSI